MEKIWLHLSAEVSGSSLAELSEHEEERSTKRLKERMSYEKSYCFSFSLIYEFNSIN